MERPDWLGDAFLLASEANCGQPSRDGAGAAFLVNVASDAWDRCVDNGRPIDSDEVAELANEAPCDYTHQRWQEFVDLCAYDEDISEYGEHGDDLTKAAGIALYMIAERLALKVVEAYTSLMDSEPS